MAGCSDLRGVGSRLPRVNSLYLSWESGTNDVECNLSNESVLPHDVSWQGLSCCGAQTGSRQCCLLPRLWLVVCWGVVEALLMHLRYQQGRDPLWALLESFGGGRGFGGHQQVTGYFEDVADTGSAEMSRGTVGGAAR